MTYNGTPYYFFKNLQGDIISITDDSGAVVANYTYDAWGVCTITSDISGVNIATINPFRYRGYYYDTEIGMYYLQSRYYNPTVGRFINADDVQIMCSNIVNISCNAYFYCENNSINQIDSYGFSSINIRSCNIKNLIVWLLKKAYDKWIDGKEYKIINLSFLGIQIYLSMSVSKKDSNVKKIRMSDGAVEINGSNASFKIGRNKFSYSNSIVVRNTTIIGKFAMGSRSMSFGVTLISPIYNKNGTKIATGSINFVININHWTSLGIAVISGAAVVFAPQLSPAVAKMWSTVLTITKYPAVLITSLSSILKIFSACPA